ncbi:MAG: rod shape-determining protein RodA [Cytophagia bacterium]|jgi:hypothetical protein|nr:rod shape-determining protein RodA [Cytophagia bacterium]|tara:strand:+ start:442 stop:879 length:438 start_codon:yes stop_codon:yes gene_type:complete
MRIILIFLFVFSFSCSDKKKKESSVNDVNDINDVVTKNVFFKWPKDGSTVASPVFIDMGVEGMMIEPAGIVKEGYGHHHILINQKFWPEGEVIPTSDSTLHFGKGQTDVSLELDPGRYIISLQFADGVHVSFGELMSESIEINVE